MQCQRPVGLDLGVEKILEEENGYPLWFSGLENSMDYTVHEVSKSWTQLSNFHLHNKGMLALEPLLSF